MPSSPRIARGAEIVRCRFRLSARHRASRPFRPVLQDLESRSLLSGASPYEPTGAEQYMLELINLIRANPAAAGQQFVAIAQSDPVIEAATRGEDLNQFLQVIDSFSPEPPLAFNTGLIEAALDHDNAMLAANDQFHSPPGYLNNPQVATATDGLAYYPTGANGWATGENIFAYSASVPAGSSDQAYVNYFNDAFFLDWGNPDFGHLKNLLAPGPAEAAPGTLAFSEVGIGLLTGAIPTTPPDPNNAVSANLGLNVGPDIITQEFGWNSGNAFLTGVIYVDNSHTGFYAPGEGLGSVTIQAVGENGQGTFQTQTWDSGGYSLPLPPGTYNVEASGGGLPTTQTTTITIGQDNVPWNIPLSTTGGTATASSSAASAASTFNSSLFAVIPSTPTPAPTPTPAAESTSTPGATQPSTASGIVTAQSSHTKTIKNAHKPAHPHGPQVHPRPTQMRAHETVHADIATPATHHGARRPAHPVQPRTA